MSVVNGYSSNVRLQLIVGERTFEVEQALRGTCLLAEPIDHPPCEGELVMHVDGRPRVWFERIALGNAAGQRWHEHRLTAFVGLLEHHFYEHRFTRH